MKKLIIVLVILGIIGAGAYYYQDQIKNFIQTNISQTEKVPRTAQKISRGLPPRKEIEVFDLKRETADLSFSKSAIASSETTAYVTAQINGKITDLKVELGDKVKKNQILATLGDSLSTDIADLQYSSALQSENLSSYSRELTTYSAEETYYLAQIAEDSAQKAYQNAIQSRNNSSDVLDLQLESAEEGLENAEDAYEEARDAYQDAQDAPLPPEQLAQLKQAREQAKNAVKQAELAVEQLEETINSQLDQLDFAVESAFNQYQAARIQTESAYVGALQQQIGAESQLLQAESQLGSAALNKDYQQLRSPINGVVTSISTKENTLVNPGQALIRVEDPNTLSIETSVNTKEAELLRIGDKVIIQNDKILEGTIISISPVADEVSKKIKVKIIADNSDITAGTFIKVAFSPVPRNKIFIPLNSIQLFDNMRYVKIVNKNTYTIENQEVEIGQIVGDFVEITSGLQGNELVAKAQTTFLEEGDKVALAN